MGLWFIMIPVKSGYGLKIPSWKFWMKGDNHLSRRETITRRSEERFWCLRVSAFMQELS